ncbi:MAG: fructose-1,6-bisphosphatase [Chloroflexi bacterium]|nr:fructose-1,6-bisphosphatase [Chloroflexota bacterium]
MDVVATIRRTLNEYTSGVLKSDPKYDGLEYVLAAIADGAQQVQAKVQAASLADALGSDGHTNVQGEIVQFLDTYASDTFVEVLRDSGHVAAMSCEEIDHTVIVGNHPDQRFIIQMDPLDGSSNIDVAVSIGSIFGIWKREEGQPITDASLLKPGNEQVAAVYVVYGSSTILVLANEDGVQGFTMDPEDRDFRLTHPDIRIPTEVTTYSTNEGNHSKLDYATQEAVATLREAYSLRYVGSLVADFHRNLLKGGIFLYPCDRSNTHGKLRLMYEANPLAYVAEQAGGAASSGSQRILDIQPEGLHQRIPLIIGNRDVVESTIAIMIDAHDASGD